MSLSSYTVYVDTNAVSVSIDPTANLATLRTQLGSNINGTDVFLYFNPVTSQKTVLPMTSEDKVPVSDILFPPVAGSGNQIIEVVSNAAGSPSFLGSTTPSGYLNTSPNFAFDRIAMDGIAYFFAYRYSYTKMFLLRFCQYVHNKLTIRI